MFGECQQTLVQAETEAHRSAGFHRQEHDERFHLAKALAAETAADIARMDADVIGGSPEYPRYIAAQHEWVLVA